MRKAYTENEIILCTYIARFGRGLFNERRIVELQNRSESSLKMKVQNIASMLNEEGLQHSDEVSRLSGLPTGQKGRKTNWDIVQPLAHLNKESFQKKCLDILSIKKRSF